jgi:hypothetical protein
VSGLASRTLNQLDGEVVCAPLGISDLDRKGSREAFLYAFDRLELDGDDMRHEPSFWSSCNQSDPNEVEEVYEFISSQQWAFACPPGA